MAKTQQNPAVEPRKLTGKPAISRVRTKSTHNIAPKAPGRKGKANSRPDGARKTKKSSAKGASSPRQATVRPGTKLAQLIALLERRQGATIAEAMEATGWQAHSVRGAISGALKKKFGHTVSSEKVDGRGRVYRIIRQR